MEGFSLSLGLPTTPHQVGTTPHPTRSRFPLLVEHSIETDTMTSLKKEWYTQQELNLSSDTIEIVWNSTLLDEC